MQPPVPEMAEPRTEIAAQEFADGHAKIRLPMGIHGQAFDRARCLLAHHPFNGGSDLPLV
jgi:hypothetical protein